MTHEQVLQPRDDPVRRGKRNPAVAMMAMPRYTPSVIPLSIEGLQSIAWTSHQGRSAPALSVRESTS